MRGARSLTLWAASALALTGCGAIEIDQEALQAAAPQRVAILPFVLTESERGDRAREKVAALRGVFARRFASTTYQSLRTDVVDRRLRRAGYLTPAAVAALAPERLGALLGVDAILTGTIETLSNFEGLLVFHQRIGGTFRLLEARTGKQLVSIEHTERDTGGMLVEFSQSLEAMQRTLDNSSDLGFIRLAEKFANAVVQKIPPPPRPAAATQPTLGAVTLQASRPGTLRAGDSIDVEVRAAAGLRVVLAFGTHKRMPLDEEEAGVYRGHYDVVVGDHLDEPLSVYGVDAFGRGASRVLRAATQPIDARPPAKPEALVGALRGARVRLTWTASRAHPAVSYRVYGVSDQGVPKQLAQVEGLAAEVPQGSARYGVAGLDAQGNLGRVALVDAPVAPQAPAAGGR